jgi:hypothetical protein
MGAVGAFALVVALVSASICPVAATPDGYCQLWARDVAELEVRTGAQLNLIFEGDSLVFSRRDDVDLKTADGNLVEIRAETQFRTCMAIPEYDALPLPDLPTAHAENWATTVALYAVGRQGTEPAGVDPTPNPASAAEWRAACEAEYRTWDEADGTVVRRGSSERVPCPLKLIDGEWRVPK